MAWWTLFKRELSGYFHSGVAYVVLFGSAIVQGIVYYWLLEQFSERHITQANVMQVFFVTPLFWILFLVQIPLITMRVFSEELKMGTIEMLLTAPVRDWDVVIAKFLGSLTFFLILWSPLALDYIATQLFSSPPPPVYWTQLGLTALTLTLVGSFYISIGVFTSSLTKNQIVAAVLCFAFLFIPFGLSLMQYIRNVNETVLALVSYLSSPEHLANAGQSLFDSRPIVYYVTASLLMLYLTKSVVEGRRLKG